MADTEVQGPLTLGQWRIRQGYKKLPLDSDTNTVKELGAELIDIIHGFKCKNSSYESGRCFDTAMMRVEEAVMWALNGLTK